MTSESVSNGFHTEGSDLPRLEAVETLFIFWNTHFPDVYEILLPHCLR